MPKNEAWVILLVKSSKMYSIFIFLFFYDKGLFVLVFFHSSSAREHCPWSHKDGISRWKD